MATQIFAEFALVYSSTFTQFQKLILQIHGHRTLSVLLDFSLKIFYANTTFHRLTYRRDLAELVSSPVNNICVNCCGSRNYINDHYWAGRSRKLAKKLILKLITNSLFIRCSCLLRFLATSRVLGSHYPAR